MLRRLVQLLLAFVLCWSGFTASAQAQPPALLAGEQLEATGLDSTGDLPHCSPSGAADPDPDDRPVQAQAESGTDLPALVQRPAVTQSAPAAVRPAPHRMAAWLAPTLDGLRRPPRGQASST